MQVSPLQSKAKASGEAVKRDGDEAPFSLVILARGGYAARGVIYLVIGSLALMKAFGKAGDSTDSKGAIGKLLEAPFGSALLWLVAIGLIGYAIWRFFQSALNADGHENDFKGIAVRAGLLLSCLVHSALALYTIRLALSLGSSDGSGNGPEGYVAMAMGLPLGKWIVGLVALCIAGIGFSHVYKAFKEKYKERFEASDRTLKLVNHVCKFGLSARGVAFLIIAGMTLSAAITQDADDAGGLEEVLGALQRQPYGQALLAVMAIGLIAFAAYSFVESAIRRIRA